MKKSIRIIAAFLLLFTAKSYSQGLHGGISSGSVGVLGLELGYSIKEDIHLGLNIVPKFSAAESAGYYGAYGRKTFRESELFSVMSLRPYLSATLGLISEPNDSYIDLSNWNFEEVNNKGKNTFGGAVGGGIELLFGRSGKIASPIEIGFGKMPNLFKSITGSMTSGSSYGKSYTSAFYFNAGLRFYLSN